MQLSAAIFAGSVSLCLGCTKWEGFASQICVARAWMSFSCQSLKEKVIS